MSDEARRPRALLLNPPFPDLVIRDYYCSKTTKSNYIFQPVDLVTLSGRLHAGYELRLIDAVVDRLTPDQCLAQALAFAPDVVVFMTGAVSWEQDFPFLVRLKAGLAEGARFIGSGDIFQEEGERWLQEHAFIDAALRDFSNADALHYLAGQDELI